VLLADNAFVRYFPEGRFYFPVMNLFRNFTMFCFCFIHSGHAKCVKLLLEYGADPTARMVGGWTPAHCAAETGRLNVLKVLIDHQAPVIIADNSGDTPKRVAEIYGHTACVELLKRLSVVEFVFICRELQ